MKLLNSYTIIFLLLSGTANADKVTCTWIGNENLILFEADTLWPGTSLHDAAVYDFKSAPTRIESTLLNGIDKTSGKFKGFLAFPYKIVGVRNQDREIIFPTNFTSLKTFIAHDSTPSGSSFESLFCKMQYME